MWGKVDTCTRCAGMRNIRFGRGFRNWNPDTVSYNLSMYIFVSYISSVTVLDKVTCKYHCSGQNQKQLFRPLFSLDLGFPSWNFVDISYVWMSLSIVLAQEAQVIRWKYIARSKLKTGDKFLHHVPWLLISLTTDSRYKMYYVFN